MVVRIDHRYLRPSEYLLGFTSPVVRPLKPHDKLDPAHEYLYKPARLTPREAEFCKLLIDLACQLGERRIPVIFASQEGRLILDKGCIKIAEHQGFIRPLQNDDEGLVSFIELNFKIDGGLG